MKKTKTIIQISLIIIIMMIVNFLQIANFTYANDEKLNNREILDSAYLYSTGDCGSLLKYKGVIVKVSYVEYQNEGVSYPAYCMDKTKPRSRNKSI